MMLKDLSDTAKHILDAGALTITIGTIFSWLPHVTAVLALVWTVMRLYEEHLNIQIKQANLKGMRCAACPDSEDD